MADTLPTPITNQEHFLNGIAGNEDVTNIPAITNEEKFLKYIALNGGGGGTSPFYPAGNIAFASLPNPSADILGAMYNITDAFTTDSRFNEGSGVKYPAGTNVAVVNTGTEQSPVYKFDTYAGAYIVDDAFSATSENPVQNKVVKSALDAKADTSAVNSALALKVDKVEGKGLSTNDYTNADKSAVGNSLISSTTSGINPTITNSANGYVQNITVYGRTDTVKGELRGIGEDGELDITTCGKNVIPITMNAIKNNNVGAWNNNTISINNVSFTVNTDVDGNVTNITANGTASANALLVLSEQKFLSGKFKISGVNGGGESTYRIDIRDNYSHVLYVLTNGIIETQNIYNICVCVIRVQSGCVMNNVVFHPMMYAFSETDDTYEPYVSSTATVTTGIPLYSLMETKDSAGFTSNVVHKKCRIIDLGSLDWVTTPYDYVYSCYAPNDSHKNIGGGLYVMCSGYDCFQGSINDFFTSDKTIMMNSSEYSVSLKILNIRDTRYNDLSTFKTAVTGVKLVYPLATPYEIPLTSAELSALRGLRTYNPTTNITVTDAPSVDVGYLLDTDNGQAVADVESGLQAQINAIPAFLAAIPEMHRNIFRGKSLGSSVTAAQLAAIADGSFHDLFVGDYWTSSETINGETVTVKWRIADMDYFYQKGKWADLNVMVHHIIVLPDVALRNAVYGTDFTADNAMVDAVFQNHRLTVYFSDDASTWTGFTTHHLNSYMLFGYDRTDAQSPYKYPVMNQLSLFRIAPKFMTPYYEENSNLFASQWIMRSNNYPRMTVRGAIFSENSDAVGGFRPWFVIGTDNANNG